LRYYQKPLPALKIDPCISRVTGWSQSFLVSRGQMAMLEFLGSTDFSLWLFVWTKIKFHALKPVLLDRILGKIGVSFILVLGAAE
jgi:hypothetical protein